MSVANLLPAAMTAAEFLAWNPQDSDRWELVDGSARAMAPASPRHGAIQAETSRLIGNHLAHHRPACSVMVEPDIQPKVRANLNVRVPDLAVTCAPWGGDAPLLSDPVLVIEIHSPSDKADTWANVWSYVTIPSVQEILVLHTTEMGADLLRRAADGIWPDNPSTLGAKNDVMLDSIGFAVPLSQFYRTAGLVTPAAASSRTV